MNLSVRANDLIKQVTTGKEHIKFTVGVIHKGKTDFKLFDSKGEIPYESYQYEMGSIGKTFTTSLLAKYIHAGKMDLNDSVAKYIPELESNNYYPTLKRLATHTAGYPSRYPADDFGELFQMIWKKIRNKPIKLSDYLTMDKKKMIRLATESNVQDRDYKWMYSNFGIALLGYAISNVAKKSFFELLTNYFNDDLGLKNSFVGDNHKNLLRGYDMKNRDVGNWGFAETECIIPAGACMVSNAEDLLEFARLNFEESLDYLSLCHVSQGVSSESKKWGLAWEMGLGWWISKKNPNVIFHGGNTSGFATMLAFDKQKKASVVLLANVNFYKEREELFMDILENL